MKKVFKNQKGFTLVELLAVIVILGIIAAIAIPSIGSIIDKSKKDAHIANAEMLVSAARLAVAANDTKLWVTQDTTNDKTDLENSMTIKELVDAGYLENTIEDPDNVGKSYISGVVTYDPEADSDADKYRVHLNGLKRYVGMSATTGIGASKLDRNAIVNKKN